MGLLRPIGITTAAAALPAVVVLKSSLPPSSDSPSSSSPSLQIFRTTRDLSFFSPSSASRPSRLRLSSAFASPPSALAMDALPPSQEPAGALPELLTEFMVDMKCDGCVKAVQNKLQIAPGVKSIEVDLNNQVVRVLGSSSVKVMTDALEQTGRKARLIGQGTPEDFLVSAAVAEFKGPDIFGVVRVAQVNMELTRIEANFSGLSPGKHGWSINEFGDLTKGAASTGKVYNSTNQEAGKEPLGDLGTLEASLNGEAFFSGSKRVLRVGDLIGRSVVVYDTEDKSDIGLAAAVIARSAGVGENYKKICTCDGTTIWESTNADFVTGKI